MRIGAAAVLAVLMLAGAIAGGYLLALHALSESQHALCPIVELVTKKPVPHPADPAANPSRLQAWEFYEDFLTVKRQYGCR